MGGSPATGRVFRSRSALPSDGPPAADMGGACHRALGRRPGQRSVVGDGRRVCRCTARWPEAARLRAADRARRQCAGDVAADSQCPRRAWRICGPAHGRVLHAGRAGGSARGKDATAGRRWPRPRAAGGLRHDQEPGGSLAGGHPAGPPRRGNAQTRSAHRGAGVRHLRANHPRARAHRYDDPRLPAVAAVHDALERAVRRLVLVRELESTLVFRAGHCGARLAAAAVARGGADHVHRRRGPHVPVRRLRVHQRVSLGRGPVDGEPCDAAFGTAGRRLDAAHAPGMARGARARAGARGPSRVMQSRALADVTLACVDTVNHALALRALAASAQRIAFGRVVFLTHGLPEDAAPAPGIDVVDIEPLRSRDEYSHFGLKRLVEHVHTRHVLLVQWDGYVVNADAWESAFGDVDYLGARWFWHTDGHDVGNGGFSLRSHRLLDALQDPRIELVEAEDTTIGRTFRTLLEREHGIRFGSPALADRFAFEAAYPIGKPFGFHGLYNFCRVVPPPELAALVSAFSAAILRSPQLAQLLRNCVALGQWLPAIAIASRVLELMPDNAEARMLLDRSVAAAARGEGVGRNDRCPCGSGRRFKHCHGDVSKRPAHDSGDGETADAAVGRALEAHQRGELDAASRDYRAALARSPDHPHALHYLGVIAYQQGRLADALPMLQRAVAQVAHEPEFHNNLGLVLAALDRDDEAVDAFRKALALRPDHAGAWNNLGLALHARNELAGAIDA